MPLLTQTRVGIGLPLPLSHLEVGIPFLLLRVQVILVNAYAVVETIDG